MSCSFLLICLLCILDLCGAVQPPSINIFRECWVRQGWIFGSFLWWFWYSVVQKIYSLIIVFMESQLTVFSLMPPLSFHRLSFYYPLVEILIKVIFKSPFSKICLKQRGLFLGQFSPFLMPTQNNDCPYLSPNSL